MVEKNIKIYGTKNLFDFNIKICEDSLCSKESRLFLKNKEIYLDYESEIKDLEITAFLTSPDEFNKEIEIPRLINAEQIGTYEIEVSASKEGYRTITKKEQFGIIEEHANIQKVPVPVISKLNKTQEQGDFNKIKQKNSSINLMLIIGILVIILILIIIYIFYKKKI